MQLRPQQLAARLESELAPVYLVFGDEPLLVQEAADAVREQARTQGFGERRVFTVESGFDWGQLTEAAGSLSLFAERRLLELRMPGGRPGEAGARALRAYAEAPPPDTVLLVISGKLDAAQRKGKWFRALDQAGVSVAVWPVGERELPDWIGQRMRTRGLRPSPEAVRLLAARVEGNLLACAQEIEKLSLVLGPGEVDAEALAAAVADSARFDVFALADAVVAGHAGRAVRILQALRAEGVVPVPIVATLARELRGLAGMAAAVEAGAAPAQVMGRFGVWRTRQAAVRAALGRAGARTWEGLLRRCARLDRLAKGQAPGNPWDELVQLVLAAAGRPVPLRS